MRWRGWCGGGAAAGSRPARCGTARRPPRAQAPVRFDLLRGRRRHQRDGRAAERAVDERLLPSAGHGDHVVAHAAERDADVEAGLGEMPDQRGGVRAVDAVAVIGNRTGLGGIGDQRVGADVVDLGKPAPGGGADADGAQLCGKRIVAAGVEQDQPQPAHRLQRPDDAVERHRLVFDVVVAAELGIDRDQIIGAADLDAVAGIVDHRDVGVLRRDQEFAHAALEVDDAEIVARNDDLEADRSEQRRDRGRSR